MEEDTFEFDVEVMGDTPDAWHLHFIDEDVKKWVPKSVCELESDGEEVEDIVHIKMWWAEREGLA